MSYRTYVNHTQLFGNNEYYPEWIEFIKSQGIKVDDCNCYEGKITDFMAALEVIEDITMKIYEENNIIFDFSDIADDLKLYKEHFNFSLFDRLNEIVNDGYAFMPYKFFMICKDKLEYVKDFNNKHLYNYKFKEGEFVIINAY